MSNKYDFTTSEKIKEIRKRRDMIEKERNKNWVPTSFLFYGPGGVGKTSFVKKIFCKCYEKPKVEKNKNSWWTGYRGEEVVLLDEFQTKIGWEELTYILDESNCEVEERFGNFIPFFAKYVFMTSVKSFNDLYEDQYNELFDDLYQLIDYIVEFKNDGKIKVHKGNSEKFFNMEWDIEFRDDSFNNRDIIKKAEVFNKDIDGKYFDIGGKVYWRRDFSKEKKEFLKKSGKTSLIETLFGDEMYNKLPKYLDCNYWDDYDGEEIVLLDKYHKKIDWRDMMKLLNDSDYEIEVDEGIFKPFTTKYLFTTNRMSPEDAYELNQGDKSGLNKFLNRIDYIIEFKGKWNDDVNKRTTELVFHKGSKKKFHNMEWDVELNNDEYNKEMFVEGIHFEKNGKTYWRRKFPEYMKRYLKDYPRCKEIYEYIEDRYSKKDKYKKGKISERDYNIVVRDSNDDVRVVKHIKNKERSGLHPNDFSKKMNQKSRSLWSHDEVAVYLKNKNLKPKVIKNYLINNGRLLFNTVKSLRYGSLILLDDGSIKDLEIIKLGKYTIFGDDGTDIWCNFQGYPLLIQCKYRTICRFCITKSKTCYHKYWKDDMITDVKKFDDKLSEYKVPIFGIFVINNGIGIHKEIHNMRFKNSMIVINFSNELKNQIDELGKIFLSKTQNMDWSISLNDNSRIELDVVYRSLEAILDNRLVSYSDLFFNNMKKILYYVRKAYNITSLNDICNNLDTLNIV
ncbi:4360_t:CDS:2 [Scutellospora calospora]|uniref:4360_t:CDS:1 n=1 Tax=Scutellospora calospora TaxID=85575 RepID=A0ACA9JY30_9GLOM|nr:4360_t:CDS:2 [Scutellospora calospora]